MLKTLVAYRLIDPGSEWRLHRHWFDHSALGDLLGEDFAIAHSHTLYRCLDHLVAHKQALFSYLQERWRSLFDARFDVLLYDLDQHLLRMRPARTGQAHLRLQPRQTLRLCPGGHRPDRHPGRVFRWPMRCCAGNTLDKQTLTDFPRQDRRPSTARPSASG